MMKNYTDKQNHVLNCLAYADIEGEGSWKPGMKLVELVDEPYKSQLQDAGLANLEIVDYTNNNDSGSYSGFCAIAFRDPETGERGMSFRGTENLDNFIFANQVDMMDNVHTALTGESAQKKEALAFFERNKALYGDNYLFGHSKGGELASEVYVEYYQEIREMHILNPQPINPYLLSNDQREALKSDKVDVVIIDGDTVHSLGAWPFSDDNTRIIENNGTKDGLFGPHLKESARIDGDNYVIEETPFVDYPEQEKFRKVVQPLIEAAQKGYLPRNAIFFYTLTSIYTFMVRDIPAVVERFKEAVIKVTEFFIEAKEKIKQFVSDINDFVQTAVNAIKNCWNSVFNAGYKYATANPQIKVDTFKLRDYASRLHKVNNRITKLDRRLDSLYWKVGLLDLWNLMQADLMTGYSWRLLRAATYLYDVASDFEKTEKDLANAL